MEKYALLQTPDGETPKTGGKPPNGGCERKGEMTTLECHLIDICDFWLKTRVAVELVCGDARWV